MSPESALRFLRTAREAADQVAVIAREGVFCYSDLLSASARVANYLLGGHDTPRSRRDPPQSPRDTSQSRRDPPRARRDLEEARVVFLVPPGFEYAAVQWGIWRAGGVAVPLALAHPPAELASLIADADPEAILVHASVEAKARPAAEAHGIPVGLVSQALAAPVPVSSPLPSLDESRRAQIIYTSGTTGKPKGAVTTHANTRAQVESLARAWRITAADRVLNALPFHHVHGIINALACPLSCGARVEILPRFDALEVWDRFAAGRVDVFMGVPTMYVRLIAAWEEAPPARRRRLSEACRKLRLMISGSAALPVGTLERWKDISGHVLLERYGLTETGMVLSNPLLGRRVPGHVGSPLPGVDVRLAREDGTTARDGEEGGVEVRGETVFVEYWRRPGETATAFRDGWFRTGDRAVLADGQFRILGRESVDIIKTGGEKVSALEVEEVLRAHPAVDDCAVVGIPDPEWGECVCAAVVPGDPAAPPPEGLREWTKGYLAAYKAPVRTLAVSALPRNSMGKVVKADVCALFSRDDPGSHGTRP